MSGELRGMRRCLLFLLLLTGPLLSVQLPLSEEALLGASKLVVDGQCVGVTFRGKNESQILRSVTWDCRIRVSRVVKGKAPRALIVRADQVLLQGSYGDGPARALPPGWMGRLYLVPGEPGTYRLVHNSGAKENANRSRPRPFPPAP